MLMVHSAMAAMTGAGTSGGKTVADWNEHCRALVPSATAYNAGVGADGSTRLLRAQGAPGWNTNEFMSGSPRWPVGNFGEANLRGLARHCVDALDFPVFDGSSDILISTYGDFNVLYPSGLNYNGFQSEDDQSGFGKTEVTYAAYWTAEGAIETWPGSDLRRPYLLNGWTP